MHSLFTRIFLLFWVAMALIVGGSIAMTLAVTSREYDSADLQRRPNAAIQASEVVAHGGLAALRAWLQANQRAYGDHDLYVIGPDGRDILGRTLSPIALRRLEFFSRALALHGGARPPDGLPPPQNFHPPHMAPQIVAPDGRVYSVLLAPRRPSIFGALGLPNIAFAILGMALVVSALASGWLARHLATPIRQIQAGARAVASENLDVRVSAGLESRRDEVAVLARDFDAMADRLRANRAAVTRLLRDISHELRSPLARLRLAVGLARQAPADMALQLTRMERETERLDRLISHILELARLPGAAAQFTRERFDADELLEEIVRDANFEAAAQGGRVVAGAAAHVLLHANRELLRSAVENVLRNAVRYSPPSLPVQIGCERPQGGLRIVVRDHGPGVPEDDLERIFTPFYRVAESRDRDSGGEGVGLAITAQVMQAHGGTATAHNAAGGGLEVRLTLPRAALAG